jgi:glycosyltransferase involved in cell wall biosynthesis
MPQRSHVLQIVLSLTPGGTERLVMEICRRTASEFRSTVCCLDDEGAWAAELRNEGIEVLALRRAPGFRPSVGRRIARIAEERGIRVAHCHQYSPFVYGRIASWHHPRLKLVYTEHGRLSDDPPSWKRRAVNPLLSRFDGAGVAVSHELRDYMISARFAADRLQVIHNGIDPGPRPSTDDRLAARRLLGIRDGRFVAMTVARLDPVKDLAGLLDAFARVRVHVPDACLVIVGDGPERARLERRAANADLGGSVVMTGYRSNVRALLPAADLYVSNSISEGISITILEAMAAAVPVVATSVGGTPEVLDGNVGGMLVPARAPERMAAAVTGLARDAARRASIGADGRRRVETAFTIDRMVGEYARIYRQLLDLTCAASAA